MARCVSSHTSQRAPSGSAGNDAESRARCRCMAMAESAVGSRTNSEEPTRWCLGLCPGSGGRARPRPIVRPVFTKLTSPASLALAFAEFGSKGASEKRIDIWLGWLFYQASQGAT